MEEHSRQAREVRASETQFVHYEHAASSRITAILGKDGWNKFVKMSLWLPSQI